MGLYSIGASGLSNKPGFSPATKPMNKNTAGNIFNNGKEPIKDNGKGIVNNYTNPKAQLKTDADFFKSAFLGLG